MMKKYLLPICIIIFSATITQAFGDFIQFGTPMSRNDWYYQNMQNDINSTINSTNRNNWSNPYAYSDFENPIAKIFKTKNSSTYKYSEKSLKDSDVDYLLTKMEKNRFGMTFQHLDINTRLDRLDSVVFGAIQEGDYKTRLNRLKHAFSAQSTRGYKAKNDKLRNFKHFFSSGRPTSIPADEDYYSSLNNSIW